MRANNPIETQEVTSDSKECDFQIFSPGVHTIFLLAISPIFNFRSHIRHFSEKITIFSKALWCFGKCTRSKLFFREKELVTKIQFMKKYFIYFWYTPIRHTKYRICRKSQIGFPKMGEIKVKSDERQGKIKHHLEKSMIIYHF